MKSRGLVGERAEGTVRIHWLPKQLEMGVRCPEPELNERLRRYNPDYASLRRYLVDYGFMQREKGVYWHVEPAGSG